MNVHQLELFYHVVRHQSVSKAAHALEKEQPTLSKQINELEQALQVKLYHRRPFQLTEKGELLFQRIAPFFQDLPRLEELVRGGDIIRIGASPIVLMHHLPAIEREVRRGFPKLRLMLRESSHIQLVQWLEQGEIDLAITLLPRSLPPKLLGKQLLCLSPILLVPRNYPVTSLEEVLRRGAIDRETLICLPREEMICREFQQKMQEIGVEWRPGIEVGSLSLVEHYVQEGYGIGLSFQIPGIPIPPQLRAIPLSLCPDIPFGIIWRDHPDKLLRAFRIEIERRANQFGRHPNEMAEG